MHAFPIVYNHRNTTSKPLLSGKTLRLKPPPSDTRKGKTLLFAVGYQSK